MRHQLPASSPLAATAILAAAREAATGRGTRRAAELEERLRRRLGDVRDVRLLDSGTHALQMALQATAAGGTAALPAYNCYDLVTAALGAEVRVAFYDIDPATLTPDLDSLRRVLRAGADAVVVANLFGFPLPWDAIRSLTDEAGVLVVEDAAQGLGAEWAGRPAGAHGDLVVLSFGRGKGWTGGAGGALIGRKETLPPAPSVAPASLPLAAVALGQWTLGRPALFGLAMALPGLQLGETRFHHPSPPRGMAPFAAALALRVEDASFEAVQIRRRRAETWRTSLAHLRSSLRLCSPVDGGRSGYLRLPVLGGGARAFLDSAAARRAGVARGYPRALPDLPDARAVEVEGREGLAGARELAAELRTLPTHAMVRPRDVETVRRGLEAAAAGA